jgi:hypothetical protein
VSDLLLSIFYRSFGIICFARRTSLVSTYMLMRISLSLPVVLVLLSGCASIVSKSSRPVTITSSPIGAKVTISKSSGVPIQVGETPMTVTLETSNGFFTKAKYTVEATKPGYQTSSAVISADLNGWYFGNIVFGGLIGLLIVDPATGAMWKLDDTYSVNLAPTKKVALSNGETVHVVSISDIPTHLRSKLVKVGRLASGSIRN